MQGKNKCRILKEIRQKIADKNDIPYVTRECSYQGDCTGTCPRCESELRYLERQLAERQRLGKKVTVAALCAGFAVFAAGCTPTDTIGPTTLGGTAPSIEAPRHTEQTTLPEGNPFVPEALTGDVLTEVEGELAVPPEELMGKVALSPEALAGEETPDENGGEFPPLAGVPAAPFEQPEELTGDVLPEVEPVEADPDPGRAILPVQPKPTPEER